MDIVIDPTQTNKEIVFSKKTKKTIQIDTPIGGSYFPEIIWIETHIRRNIDGDKMLLLSVDSHFRLDGVTLRYFRSCRSSDRDGNGQERRSLKRTGWHRVYEKEEGKPMNWERDEIRPAFASTTPLFTSFGKSYYSVVFNEKSSISQFESDDETTGYLRTKGEEEHYMTRIELMRRAGGICLMKNNVQISNFAKVRSKMADDGKYYISL